MSPQIKITVTLADEIKRTPVAKGDIKTLGAELFMTEGVEDASASIIFVGAERIQSMNREYLGHDYPTDVISFSLHDEGEAIEGEIYICTDTARSQAQDYGVTYADELIRLTVHGLLHLIGFDDQTPDERNSMLELGEKYVKLFYAVSARNSRSETKS